jgi:hypothetical protein
MKEPLILFSTNTWLAYIISERFYNGIHYVWCSPYFNSKVLPDYDCTNPPTSNPIEIYKILQEESLRGDRHSPKIKENKVGIIKGAIYNQKMGVITEEQKKDIIAIVEIAETKDFRPLLYLIPFSIVSSIVKAVPVKDRAHPLSMEFVIESLPRNLFEIIEFYIG